MSKWFLRVLLVVFVLSLGVSLVSAQDDSTQCVTVSQHAASSWVRNINPFAPDPLQETTDGIYEPLLLWNPVGGGVPTPWLATDYAYNDDLTTLTFNLRDDVLWNDGEPFTAQDVAYTFELLQSKPELDRAGYLGIADSVEATSDTQVVFHLSSVNSLAHVVLGQMNPVPEHIWSEIEDPVTFLNENPVATGPISIVQRFEDQVYELGANPTYWQEGKPQVPCFRFPAYPGNEQSNLAMVEGIVDWGSHFIPDIDTTYVAADPEHFNYFFWPGGGEVNLYANTTKAPFDDVNLRRAMSAAIDLESVVNIGMYGYTIPANPIGLGPRYDSWVSQAALDKAAEMGLGTYSPETAAAILDEAGYVDVDGDGFRETPAGEPLAFNVQVVNGWTDWVTSVQIISQNFQDVGLNAQMVTPEFGEWLNNLQNGDYDVSIGWSDAGPTPWDFYRSMTDSSLIGENGMRNATTWAGWTSPEMDALLASFTSTADAEEQKTIAGQIQELFVENVVAIPLFPGPTWYEWNTTRFTGFPTEEDYYAQGSEWRGYANSGRLLTFLNIRPVGQ
ncbi:MAG: ABC transporter substrate-binding protein [Anaerolineae bacterium]